VNKQVIEVRIWGQRVGAVAPDPKAGCYAFEYDQKWLEKGIELAPIMMPAREKTTRIYAFPALPETSFKGLPGLLSDALPDDFGNALIDAWMAAKGIVKNEVTTLSRLAYMGKRGMGALEFRPGQGAKQESKQPLEIKKLVEVARDVLHGDLKNDPHAKAALANIIRVGTSAGGARAKAVVAWNPKTQEIRSGQFDVPEGFEHWLLKFDGMGKDKELGASDHYGRVEYAYYLMTRAAKIEIQDSRLLKENGRAHFMTRRFDREKNVKHHIQSLCAIQHLDYRQRGTHAYEQLFMTNALLGLDDQANIQTFRRMVFNVMARNCDDHTKNFAYRLKKGSAWELAPAYDITHAYNPRGEWTYQHLMSVNGKFDHDNEDVITKDDLIAVAHRFNVPRAQQLIDEVRDAIESWPEHASAAELLQTDINRITKNFHII
jgi:serine/threonine-protein kinase HipA